MKIALASAGTLLFLAACGASGGGGGNPITTGGASGAGGVSGTGGAKPGGNNGGTAAAGSANGGAATAVGGATASTGGGGNGGGSGGAVTGFVCPAGPFETPKFGAAVTPVRIEGVPPSDAFNQQNGTFGIVEGPVWIGDALYLSEIGPGASPPPARILKVTAAGVVSIAIPDSGTNGLAINNAGELFGGVHKDGSISKLSLAGAAAVPVVSLFGGARFNSPNDLAIHSNGTIYFSDPDHQAPSQRPQPSTRLYRVPAGGEAAEVEELGQPNGVTLSKDQNALYVGGNQLKKYPVAADGTLGAGTTFVNGAGADGMAVDCADNLYTAHNGVTIYSAAGALIGVIAVSGLQSVTNVAFGGSERKTLYITGLGNGSQKGLFKAELNVPGFPY